MLARQGIEFRQLSAEEARSMRKEWLRVFASKVLKKKGVKVFGGYMWHGFSFRIEDAIAGAEAELAYKEQAEAPFVILDEDGELCLQCEPSAYPDLTELADDFYVAHHKMEWTMVFTHEQPEIGPFFARVR